MCKKGEFSHLIPYISRLLRPFVSLLWIKTDGKSVDEQSTQYKDVDTKLYAYGAKLRQMAYNNR